MKVKPAVPTWMVSEASRIPFEALWNHGYRGILWDLERTLIPLGCRSMTDYAVEVVEMAKAAGFVRQTCCTNSTHLYGNDVLRHFGHHLAQPNPHAGILKKPDPTIFQDGCSLLELPAEKVVMVGDKLLFDTSPAAALGMGTVLVNPLPGHDVWAEYIAFRRTREKLALRRLGIRRP
ncbi:MAG TPA: HAD hydrolase-like protein [Candidatus Saccharibacteria bacterium]|nr:HAD hydrolase-like protein [Candidatus Saccharibacteria bacterium]HMT39955.1 HAD hydrolase-like protein [Candidatus Saccharibacteria bacterium]